MIVKQQQSHPRITSHEWHNQQKQMYILRKSLEMKKGLATNGTERASMIDNSNTLAPLKEKSTFFTSNAASKGIKNTKTIKITINPRRQP